MYGDTNLDHFEHSVTPGDPQSEQDVRLAGDHVDAHRRREAADEVFRHVRRHEP